jgi:hypothetical protein
VVLDGRDRNGSHPASGLEQLPHRRGRLAVDERVAAGRSDASDSQVDEHRQRADRVVEGRDTTLERVKRRQLAAAESVGVDPCWWVSIVDVDEMSYSYYRHTRAAERAVESSTVPSTTVRLTRFHEFVGAWPLVASS